jgi:hypothetical protein
MLFSQKISLLKNFPLPYPSCQINDLAGKPGTPSCKRWHPLKQRKNTRSKTTKQSRFPMNLNKFKKASYIMSKAQDCHASYSSK